MPGRYQRFVMWAGARCWFPLFGRRVLTPIDKMLQGRPTTLATFGTDFPLGYLTTEGRRSGRRHTVPLLYVVPPNAVAAVVGTNFGGADHPAWALNLEAEPRAKWQAETEHAVAARAASGDEYAELWARFVAVWPAYETYVARSARRPKIFVLDAIAPPTPELGPGTQGPGAG